MSSRRIKVNESRYIALFVVSGSMKKLFSLINTFFQYFFYSFCHYLSFLNIFSIDFAL